MGSPPLWPHWQLSHSPFTFLKILITTTHSLGVHKMQQTTKAWILRQKAKVSHEKGELLNLTRTQQWLFWWLLQAPDLWEPDKWDKLVVRLLGADNMGTRRTFSERENVSIFLGGTSVSIIYWIWTWLLILGLQKKHWNQSSCHYQSSKSSSRL